MLSEFFDIETRLWRWQSETATAWFFLTLPDDVAKEIQFFRPKRGPGFGSIRVEVTIGETVWRTSLFPDKTSGSYLLPVKAAVRKSEKRGEGDMVACRIKVL